jgi:hypothetical protein
MRKPEQKCYAPGVSEIVEPVVNGHHEAFQLVGVTHRRIRPEGYPPPAGLGAGTTRPNVRGRHRRHERRGLAGSVSARAWRSR